MKSFGLVLLIAIPSAVWAQGTVAIRNVVVETLGIAGRLERANVVVRDGKIVAAGRDVAIPDDAEVIDGHGGTVMPGMIDPYFEVTIAGASADAGSRTVVVRGRAITVPNAAARGPAYTRIFENFYPYDAGFKSLPRIGLTRLNLIATGVGQAALVRTTPSEPQRMLAQPEGVAYVTVATQSDSLDLVRTRLETATKAKANADPAKAIAATLSGPLWADVLDGKTSLVATVPNSASVVHLLRVLEPYKNVKLVMAGAGATFVEALELMKTRPGVRAVIRPNIELAPNTRDRMAPARLLHEAGIEFAFTLTGRGTGEGDVADDASVTQDHVLFPVAMLVRAGLPRRIALESLSKRPAEILGIDQIVGTIEPGKAADLVLFTGDPLDPSSRLCLTMVEGKTTYANP